MEPSPGDEFSFPVTDNPQLEQKLMEMPKRILDKKLSIYEASKEQIKLFTATANLKTKILSGIECTDNISDEDVNKMVCEALKSNTEFQEHIERCDAIEKEIEIGQYELEYLNNYFEALQSVSTLVL